MQIMTLYVHVNEQNKPWIDMVSTEQKDGYVSVSGLMDYQVIALLNYPTKCFMDDNGVIHAPQDLPMSEQQKQAQLVPELQNKVNSLNSTIGNLQSELKTANADNSAKAQQITDLQNQVARLVLKIAQLSGGDK